MIGPSGVSRLIWLKLLLSVSHAALGSLELFLQLNSRYDSISPLILSVWRGFRCSGRAEIYLDLKTPRRLSPHFQYARW